MTSWCIALINILLGSTAATYLGEPGAGGIFRGRVLLLPEAAGRRLLSLNSEWTSYCPVISGDGTVTRKGRAMTSRLTTLINIRSCRTAAAYLGHWFGDAALREGDS